MSHPSLRALALLAALAPAAYSAEPAAPPGATAATIAALKRPCGLKGSLRNISAGQALRRVSEIHKLDIRFDEPLFRGRLGGENINEKSFLVELDADGLTLGQFLDAVVQEVGPGNSADSEGGAALDRIGLKFRGRQILITRVFVPPTVPREGRGEGEPTFASDTDILNAYYGPAVALAADNKPLAAVIDELRESSGANIVVDPQVKEKLAAPVSLTLGDARLMTALRVAGKLAGVAVAPIDNVFYVTDEATAANLQAKWERQVFGVKPPPAPPAPAPRDAAQVVTEAPKKKKKKANK